MSPEDKQRFATSFDFDDPKVLADYLDEIRTGLSVALQMEDTSGEFSDDTLLAYLTDRFLTERVTAEDAIVKTVNHAAKRFFARPMSGHPTEQPRACSDDPVGLDRDRVRFDALAAKRNRFKTSLNAEIEAAKKRRA